MAPSGGGETASAPSWQVGVDWGADEVVDGTMGGRQIVGVAVTVTVDTEQVALEEDCTAVHVLVVLAEVAHVLEEDCTAVQELVVLGDVVADDLTELLVVLGTLTVVLQCISRRNQHSFSVSVALPLVLPQCRCYNTVSIKSIKVAVYTYHPCSITSSSQLDRLDRTLHKVLLLGQLEMEGTFWLTSKAWQNCTAGANPERERKFE